VELEPLLKVMKERRTIRRFREDAVSEGDLKTVLEAATLAPSGGNSQPWEFILVRDPATKQRVADLWDRHMARQRQLDQGSFHFPSSQYLKDAPVLIMVCGDERLKKVYPSGLPPEHKEKIFLCSVAAAIQNMHLAARALGLGSGWVNIPAGSELEAELVRLLETPSYIRLLYCCPLGYPMQWPRSPTISYRRPLREIVHQERYETAKARNEAQIEEFIRAYTLRKSRQPASPGSCGESGP
jgi:nitroreductase